MPPPVSYVQPLLNDGCLYAHEADPNGGEMLLSRDDGIEFIATKNREAYESREGRRYVGMEWCLLVELGEPLSHTGINVELDANGIGCETREVKHPVRLVLPTDAELRQYAVK